MDSVSNGDLWLEDLAAQADIETGDPAGWFPSWDADRWELGPEPAFEPDPADRDCVNNAPPPPLGAPSWADWYDYCAMRDAERRQAV
jgi:hypothetical protein